MTDRYRLIELILQGENEADKKGIANCQMYNLEKAKIIAEYLIANGVIVPPCKVGDTVWHKEEGYLLDSYKIKFIYNDMAASNISRDLLFSVEDIGKTVFLTKEEAEEKLKELGK